MFVKMAMTMVGFVKEVECKGCWAGSGHELSTYSLWAQEWTKSMNKAYQSTQAREASILPCIIKRQLPQS